MVNRKRVLRLTRHALLLLQPHTARRPIRAHEGTVVAPASNRRWASDGFEIPCWNGEVVRVARLREQRVRHAHPLVAREVVIGDVLKRAHSVRDAGFG